VQPLPQRFDDIESLENFLSEPTPALAADLARVDGDVLVLGVAGKMGPTLARMAKRALPDRRVIGVARFSDPAARASLEAHGVECIACDLLDRSALGRLPNVVDGVRNVVFMAGHKFGAAGNAALTWMMNVGVPMNVAEVYREARIVTFSTACIYPFVPVDGPGADESVAPAPPAGDYANSCVGRERMFEYGSQKWGTPGRLVRLSYAIDMRYGVLHDVASAVFEQRELDLTMGYANVIWQGDANEQSLRLFAHCTSPATPINVTGPRHTSIRWLAEQFGERFGRTPRLVGSEAPTAWLEDTSASQRLFGRPRVSIEQMIDWTADWIARGRPSLGKPTHFETRDGKY